MKLVQLILALYVLVLSALPCEALCREETAPLSSQTSVPTSEDCPDDEWCSPFCQCATCPGFAVATPFRLPAQLVALSPLSADQLPVYASPHRLEVPGRIWQPPRLG